MQLKKHIDENLEKCTGQKVNASQRRTSSDNELGKSKFNCQQSMSKKDLPAQLPRENAAT